MQLEKAGKGQPAADHLLSLVLDASVEAKRSGLLFPRIIAFDRWELVGRQVASIADSSVWWIADWLAYGEMAFRDRYREAAKNTGLNYQTLRNYVWVARRFELSRRRDKLSFGHHAEVAALAEPEQGFWLRKAEELGWSRNQLRHEVRASLRERQTSGTVSSAAVVDHQKSAIVCGGENLVRVALRVTEEQLARFAAAAHHRNLALDDWVVQVLDANTAGVVCE